MNKKELSQKIKAYAQELGFDLVGITSSEKVESISFYNTWLENGFAGEMDYLKRNIEKRAEPELLLPNTKSIVCVGLNYYSKVETKGYKVAKYALGDDYHTFLKDKLQLLFDYIKKLVPELEGRVYTDTAPILERELAKRAGLGWLGKNTMLINRNKGSYFLLGEVFLNIALEYDTFHQDLCGNCNRCMVACPTDALIEPKVLDSNLCISYLTIENKKEIPVNLAKKMENNIFGCDICQDVCPWNKKFAYHTTLTEVQPRSWLSEKEIEALLNFDQETFSKTFKNSPIKRSKLRGFLRNIISAISNSQELKYIPILEKLALHEDELVKKQALMTLDTFKTN